jgi:sporulation protein YlmC with PRC-barrel domain
MKHHEFDVGYWLLDDQLIDSDGRRCGRVDDVEFSGRPGGRTRLSMILSGPGAFRRRLPRGPLRRLAERILTDREVAIPWKEIREIDVVVQLKHPAAKLGLGEGDDEAARFVNKVPGS